MKPVALVIVLLTANESLADDALDARLDQREVIIEYEPVAGSPQPAVRTGRRRSRSPACKRPVIHP